MKEFKKEYGDFMSPWAKDMQTYNNIMDSVYNDINEMYNRGIDPLRSQEGRSMLM
jgi:hypothetical protein